jgi:uncharacterized protein (DUF2384 family)
MAVTNPAQVRDDMSAFSMYLRVADQWGLNGLQRRDLVGVTERTFYRWASGRPNLSAEQRLRVSYVVNLYLDLHTIWEGDTAYADRWVLESNAAFGDRAPIDVMTGTLVDLHRVYEHVHRAAE